MTEISRRTFLSLLGSAVLVSALPKIALEYEPVLELHSPDHKTIKQYIRLGPTEGNQIGVMLDVGRIFKEMTLIDQLGYIWHPIGTSFENCIGLERNDGETIYFS